MWSKSSPRVSLDPLLGLGEGKRIQKEAMWKLGVDEYNVIIGEVSSKPPPHDFHLHGAGAL